MEKFLVGLLTALCALFGLSLLRNKRRQAAETRIDAAEVARENTRKTYEEKREDVRRASDERVAADDGAALREELLRRVRELQRRRR